MARPTRIDLAGGWYHVTARGNERRAIYRDARDRQHFLELLEEWVDRFGVGLHAYALMDNHYHLLVETPAANLSAAMHWLGVSYSGWFNRRHRRSGHLFQGRFKAIILEGVGVAATLSQYVHLNPVRLKRLGSDKAAQQRARLGAGEAPSAELVRQRLGELRQYRWSSYRAYVGLADVRGWLTCQTVLATMGPARKSRREQMGAYRTEIEAIVREGRVAAPWERVEAGLVLGSGEFVKRVRGLLKGNAQEQPALRQLRARPAFQSVVSLVEAAKGERWEAFRDRHADWGRDLVLYLGRRRCGLKLRELAALVGGVDDATISMAVQRFQKRLQVDGALKKLCHRIEETLLNMGI